MNLKNYKILLTILFSFFLFDAVYAISPNDGNKYNIQTTYKNINIKWDGNLNKADYDSTAKKKNKYGGHWDTSNAEFNISYTAGGYTGSINYYQHYLNKINGSSTNDTDSIYSELYCLDALKSGLDDLFVYRLMETNDISSQVGAMDYAIMDILISGAEAKAKYLSTQNYLARNIAIRAMAYLFNANQGDSINASCGPECYNWVNIARGMAYRWSHEGEMANIYNNINSKIRGGFGIDLSNQKAIGSSPGSSYYVKDFNLINGNSRNDAGTNIIQYAKDMFQNALKNLSEKIDKDTEQKKASVSSTSVLDKTVSKNDEDYNYDAKVYKYSFKLKDFHFEDEKKPNFSINWGYLDSSGINSAIVKMDITDEDNNKVSYNYNPFDGDANTNFPYEKNIFEIYSTYFNTNNKGNYTIDIYVEFIRLEGEGAISDDDLCLLKPEYYLNYTYDDSSLENSSNGGHDGYVGIVWYGSINDSFTSDNQRYVSILPTKNSGDTNSSNTASKTENTVPISIEVGVTCEETNCSYLIKKCYEESNNTACSAFERDCGCEYKKKACDEYNDSTACENYTNTCSATCPTTVSNDFQCCDEYNQLVNITDLKTIEINGPDPVACFADTNWRIKNAAGTDVGYNNFSVTDEADNNYTIDNNKYCAISCKEDYAFTLPPSKVLNNSGRYFTFDMSIKGTKTCYTSKIDIETFKNDVLKAEKEMIDAYNEWAFLYAASKSRVTSYTGSSRSKYKSYTSSPLGGGCIADEVSAWGDKYIYRNVSYTFYSYTSYGDKIVLTSITPITKTETYSQTTVNGTTVNADGGAAGSNSIRDGCSSATPGTEENLKTSLSNDLAAAATTLQTKIDNYDKIQKEYTECSRWAKDTSMEYDPNIQYKYFDEKYGNYASREENMEQSTFTGSTEDPEEWYCIGNINDTSYNSCDSGSLQTLPTETVTYLNCKKQDENSDEPPFSCEQKVINQSTARYMKKTYSINATYKPKVLFYNPKNGKNDAITVNEYNRISNKNNYYQINGLPISYSTKRNIYRYYINITNLGEYYNSKTIGRLSGNANAVLTQNDFKTLVNSNDGTISYNCSYLVNMGVIEDGDLYCEFTDNPTCPDCPMECIGPGCKDCDDDDCDFLCIGTGCAYNTEAGDAYFEKTISLNNMFPNGTTSRNWNQNRTDKLADKAKATISEIEKGATGKEEEAGAGIYSTTPILSITINATAASNIARYNKTEESNGGYANNTLKCYDINGYRSVACYSSFIDEVLDNKYGKVDPNSTILNYTSQRQTSINNGYFTFWNNPDPNGTLPENQTVGPAWK